MCVFLPEICMKKCVCKDQLGIRNTVKVYLDEVKTITLQLKWAINVITVCIEC